MEYTYRKIGYQSRSDIFRVFPLGDIHAGAVYCSESSIRKKVAQIQEDDFAYWVGMGDYCEAITKNDKRFDVSGLADWVNKGNIIESQRRFIVNLFKPIAHKCLGMLEGNHEVSIRLSHQDDLYSNICDDLGVIKLGYSCFLDIAFSRLNGHVSMYRGHLTHGAGAAQTDGAQINRLLAALKSFEGDWYAMGHLHCIKTESSKPILTVSKAGKIVEKTRCAAITGSWFKSYEQGQRASYAEQKGYQPTALGCPVFVFDPNNGIVDVNNGRKYN